MLNAKGIQNDIVKKKISSLEEKLYLFVRM